MYLDPGVRPDDLAGRWPIESDAAGWAVVAEDERRCVHPLSTDDHVVIGHEYGAVEVIGALAEYKSSAATLRQRSYPNV